MVLLVALAPRPCPALDLVRDGRAVATVVLPAQSNPLTAQAADTLVRYVAEITGAKLAIAREGSGIALPPGMKVFLGATDAARAAGVETAGLKYDGFVWKATGGNLLIAGRDLVFPPENDPRNSRACRGTANGVYRLLEEFGGVRWFLPTPQGTVVPRSNRFSVPGDLQRQEEPALAYLDALKSYGVWSQANAARRAVNVRIQGHSWAPALANWGDPKKLFENDPTIFALVGGKRLFTPGNQMLCTSHPDFVAMNVKYFSKLFDAGFQWAEYNQSDGWHRCECDKCNAMDQMDELEKKLGPYWNHNPDITDRSLAPAERLWVPFCEIAQQLYRKYPDRKIVALAYHPTFIPSRQITKFPPNVMIALTRESPEYHEAFAQFDRTVWLYWLDRCHAAGLTPHTLGHDMAHRLQRLVKYRVVGAAICGSDALWGLEGPTYYAMLKLAWNPRRDVDEILDDYYRNVYRGAASPMKQFFDLLEARIAIGVETQSDEERKQNAGCLTASKYFPAAYPPEVLATLDGLLAQAKAKLQDGELTKQVFAMTELQYRYLKIVATGFNCYREYREHRTPEVRQRLQATVEARNALVEEIQRMAKDKASAKDWFPGFAKYAALVASGGGIYGQLDNRPPFNGKF